MGEIVVGVDIGTSKVCVLIGQVNKANQLEILGKGLYPCNGVKKGVIVDIENTADSIRNAVKKAEVEANMKVGSAYINITGAHVSVINTRNWVNVSNENHEITAQDVEKVLYSARDVQIPEDRQVINVLARQYIVDGYDEIMDPVGMMGVKLEADMDIVAGKITSVQNILKSAERAGIRVDGLVVEAMATGEVILTPEEKEMGVVMIDVGGGLTDISVFKNKKLIFYDSIPVGGDHITNDVSIGLKIPYAEAEKIKREYGLALTSLIKNDQEVTLSELNDNRKKVVKVSAIVEIIEARVYEIFSLCQRLLEKAGISESMAGGIVLTGAGISYVDGNTHIAGEIFGVPVKIASYRSLGISRVEYGTSAGIVKYESSNRKGRIQGSDVKMQKNRGGKKESGFFKKIAKLFSDLF